MLRGRRAAHAGISLLDERILTTLSATLPARHLEEGADHLDGSIVGDWKAHHDGGVAGDGTEPRV